MNNDENYKEDVPKNDMEDISQVYEDDMENIELSSETLVVEEAEYLPLIHNDLQLIYVTILIIFAYKEFKIFFKRGSVKNG